MPDQQDFPNSWARDCDGKRTRVEVAVRPETEPGTLAPLSTFDWIEIPTSHVETWSAKDKDASIKRTSKITFPTEWDGESVRDVVKGYGTSDITFGRVSHKNDDGDFVLKHCGYVAGVGGTTNQLESKAWIYDFTELIQAVAISESLHDPTIRDVARIVTQTIVEETTIPLTDTIIIPPETEEEFAVFFERVGDVPLSERTYYSFSNPDSLSGPVIESTESFDLFEISTDEIDFETRVVLNGEQLEATHPAIKWFRDNFGIGVREFRSNRDTLYDMLLWLHDRAEVSWHFEPTANGVGLVFDVLPSRRVFAQQRMVDEMNGVIDNTPPQEYELAADSDTYRIHDTVVIEENNALYEINPVNTVRVVGDTKKSVLEGNISVDGFGQLAKPLADTDYPVVKARADPLYQAAGNTEQAAKLVETDARTIGEAKEDAKNELRSQITSATEGNVTCLGNPYIKPYDTLDAFETCGDHIDVQQLPVRYEVQSVKHEEDMTGLYRTTLSVTIHVGDDEFSFPVETTKQT